jgi:hypothetical protein
MPVQDLGDVDTGSEASIYDSTWSGEPGDDGYSTTVDLPSEEDLREGGKAATRRAIIKALAFFVACACVGAGSAFFVTREVKKYEAAADELHGLRRARQRKRQVLGPRQLRRVPQRVQHGSRLSRRLHV